MNTPSLPSGAPGRGSVPNYRGPSGVGIRSTDLCRLSVDCLRTLLSNRTARKDAGESLLDFLACVAYSSTQPGHIGDERIFSSSIGSPTAAAYETAYNAHRLEIDSVHYLTTGHPAAVLWPIALAVGAEPKSRPPWVAYLYGHEMLAQLGVRYGQALRQRGYHTTAILGAVAGAAMVALQRGASFRSVDEAMTIASTLASGRTTSFGSFLKPDQVAWATSVALHSARISEQRRPELPLGRWHLVLADLADFADLADHEEVADSAFGVRPASQAVPTHFKISGCCAYFDEPLKQLDALRDEGDLVALTVPAYVASHVTEPQGPATRESAGFDLAALALAVWEDGFGGQSLARAVRARNEARFLPSIAVASVASPTLSNRVFLPAQVRDSDGAKRELMLAYGPGRSNTYAESLKKFDFPTKTNALLRNMNHDVSSLARDIVTIARLFRLILKGFE